MFSKASVSSTKLNTEARPPISMLALVSIRYNNGAPAAVIIIEELLDTGLWETRWQSPSTNTNNSYAPSHPTTKKDGTAGSAEAPIFLESMLGWRVRTPALASGDIDVYITSV